ncbi:glutamate racemase [Enterococcus sp. LJL128]|uniref:glutamate racemase n=1 Tax=Enterococcus sp. LJL51 TaxID=3416656 RepID=UPI003CE6DEB1
MNNGAIGFIDSGVGGLTVMKEAMKQLPNERLIYLGDTARCPYGPRPAEQVVQFTWEMTSFLLKKNIKMLVIACNTATAVALEEIKEKLDIPVVGVILPGSRAALKATKINKVGVIGTVGTIKSGSYKFTMQGKVPAVQVTSLACPKFVPIVESSEYHSSVAKKVVSETLRPLKNKGLDTLILGCTHYPLLRPLIQNFMGSQMKLIDSGAETVSEVSVLLDYFNLSAAPQSVQPLNEFYTTGSAAMFKKIANDWLELETIDAYHVKLEER